LLHLWIHPFPIVEGEGDFFFDESEVLGGLDDAARAALLARQAEGMELEDGQELVEVSPSLA
jgi:nucleotide-sensitive chloride channel 1A